MDFFPVKILNMPSISFLVGVAVSAAINLTLAFAFAYAITWGVESALH
jgi:hypothetical protein